MNTLYQYLQKVDDTSQIIEREFKWVLKVLRSCETLTQVHKTEKLFLFLLKKHKVYFKALGKKDIFKKIIKDEFYDEMRSHSRKLNKI
jgi:hypothetical protein